MSPEIELLIRASAVFNDAGMTYFVAGSVASMRYGEPRMTRDIDIVAYVRLGDIPKLLDAFKMPDYYLSREAIVHALEHESQFNILDQKTGMKVDVMCVEMTLYQKSRFERARLLEVVPGIRVPFASPEDVILMKLVYYREGSGDKHLRDIASMLTVSGGEIDRAYIEEGAAELGVAREWRAVKERAGW